MCACLVHVGPACDEYMLVITVLDLPPIGLNISWKGNQKNHHKTTFNGMFIYVQDVCCLFTRKYINILKRTRRKRQNNVRTSFP